MTARRPAENAELMLHANHVHVGDVEEIGGPEGPEPTRFGDWSVKGRVSDF